MMDRPAKIASQALEGVLLLLALAYAFALCVSLREGVSLQSVVGFPLWVVMTTSWFVAPIGAVAGLIVTRWLARLSPSLAAIGGCSLGIVAGFLLSLLMVAWAQWPVLFGDAMPGPAFKLFSPNRILVYARSIVPIIAVSATGWALVRSWLRRLGSKQQ